MHRDRAEPAISPWQIALAVGWPALASAFCLTFALLPAQFPAATGRWLALSAVAEIPALFLGVIHAVALRESARAERYFTYSIGLLVLLLVGGLRLLVDLAATDLAPILGWIVIGSLVALWTADADPQLAHDRAWAVLNDRATLLALLPALFIGSLLLGLALHLGFAIAGSDAFDHWLNGALDRFDPTRLALLPALYFGLSCASIVHTHRPQFLQQRRRWLDRPWIHRLTRSHRQ